MLFYILFYLFYSTLLNKDFSHFQDENIQNLSLYIVKLV